MEIEIILKKILSNEKSKEYIPVYRFIDNQPLLGINHPSLDI